MSGALLCLKVLGIAGRDFAALRAVGRATVLGPGRRGMVVPNDESAPSLASLRGHVKAAHPAFMAPKRLTLVDAIPRTALGKPIRR